MSALRAMLQLRSSSSQSDSSSSIADNNNESLHSNTSHPSFSPSSSSSSAVHSVSTASLQLNNTSTTATLGNTLGIATTPATTTTTTTATAASPTTVINSSITSSLSSKPSSPAKKPPPFQNLGLHSGAASGNLGLVKFALDNGQPIDSVLNGVYAIHAACCSNANVAVVMFLIERGADVNARRLPRKYSNEKSVQTVGTTGSTPLHFAAANGCLAIVDILLRHGAIVDMTDKYGSSPLSVAAARNHPEVASLLRQYSAMQRGVQDLTPESEAKDPFADRRGSSDFHRGAAIITPPIRPVVSVPTSNGSGQITSQPLPTSAQRSGQTNRASGQRRISLPSITEAPSPADVPVPMPRQSCDLGRIPQSTEPLIRNSASIRSTLSQPTRNISMSPTKSEDRISVKSLARDPSDPTLSVPSNGTGSAAMSNSPANDTSPCSMQHPQIKASTPTIGGQQQQPKQKQDNDLVAPSPAVIASATTIKRRKSMGSAALLSPPTENSVHRRKSFDHLMSLMRSNSKTRRPSDASIASEGTACSSETTGTSRTSISDHRGSLDAINVNVKSKNSGSCGSKKDSLLATIKATDSDSGNGNGSTLSSHLTRSASQPALEDNIKPKRSPVTFVKEAIVARQSLDLQRLAVNLDRTADKARKSMEHRNDSDSDLPGLLFRRRTMQEIVPFPKMNNKTSQYHTMGPSVNLTTLSDNQFHQQQHSNGSTSSLQEASPRLSIGSISSGSATVSGRFSRMWSSSNSTSKENLDVNDFGDSIVSSGEHASAGTLTPNGTTNRPRNSMLNRLSGLWSRR